MAALEHGVNQTGSPGGRAGRNPHGLPFKLRGAQIATYNDHRMAMCFAILGLKVPGIKIEHPACVKKTFPNFFQKLAGPTPGGLGVSIVDGRTGAALAWAELFAD